jgi:uncharacterized membrane protein (UPF0127 family)
VKLLNVSLAATLADEAELAERPLARMKGLLGRDSLPEGRALVIKPCTSIHTFFMRFPIDVLFLDEAGRVLRAIERMPPWRLTRIYPRAACVAELWAGAIARSATREGDEVRLQNQTSTV